MLNLTETNNPWQTLSHIAFNHLVQEYDNGWANTRHVLPFPREVFLVDRDTQEGDVFQRALILDTLIDFDEYLGGSLQEMVQKEAGYLIDVRRKTGIGGWAYFPDLPELPPDADDLAQIMQVLLRAGLRQRSHHLFEEPLEVLLRQQTNVTAWETWIIPNPHQDPEQQLQTTWVHKAWGTGSDIEVVANLVYALILYDRDRYVADIDRGVAFLLNSHQQRFQWKSTWYFGEQYGTYAVTRALTAAGVEHSLIENIMTAVGNSRQADGGWGIGDQSNPLQTALALLTLSIGHHYLGRPLDMDWLACSLDYLRQTGSATAAWPASPFIQMPMGRPYGYVHTILTYESPTITSNYIAKACHHIYHYHS